MTKNFCDECGKEIKRNYVLERFIYRRKGGVGIELALCSKDGVWNKGDICAACLAALIRECADVLDPTKGREP